MLSSHKALKNVIDDLRIDIIHSHSFRADTSVSRYNHEYPIVSTIHSNLYDNYKDLYGFFIGKVFEKRQLRCLAEITAAVACAESVFHEYKNSLKNLHFIQNGIDTSIFHPAEDKHSLKARLELPLDKKIFVSIGSLIKRKDPETVISGFLKSKIAATSYLVMVGSGMLEESLRKKYKEANNIIFKGQQSNTSEYFQAADYFISASLSEGLPNSVMEAMGCGLPVFLSTIPSHREILTLNEKAGVLFNCSSPEHLAESLNDFDYSHEYIYKEAALNIINEHLNAHHMAVQYQHVYLKIMNRDRH